MIIKSLRLRNFLPFRGTQSVEFPTDSTQKIMLIMGENMRGKTSLLNAIRWCMYGVAVSRHSKEIPTHHLVNRVAISEGDWDCDVRLNFLAGDDEFELTRVIKKHQYVARPSKAQDYEVSVHMKKNGQVLAGDQVQQEIGRVAPIQMSRFFLFDGELLQEYEQLLIEGSQQGREIKNAIEQVLGVPALIRGANVLSAVERAANKKLATEAKRDAGLKNQAAELERVSNEREAKEADLADLVERLDRIREERQTLDRELEDAESFLALKSEMDGAKQRQDNAQKTIERKNQDMLDAASGAWRDLISIPLADIRKTLEARQIENTQMQAKVSRESARVDALKRIIETDACPTCEQTVTQAHKDAAGKELGRLQAAGDEFRDLSESMAELQSKISTIRAIESRGTKRILRSIEKDLMSAQVDLQSSENEIAKLEDKIRGHDTSELKRKRALRDAKSIEEGRLDQQIQTLKGEIQRLKDSIDALSRALSSKSNKRASRVKVKAETSKQLRVCFEKSIDALRDKLKSEVEEKASEAFRHMTTQERYRGLQINDNYGLTILDSTGSPVDLRSAGAEQVVAMSLIDGLNRTGQSIGPVIMDTPFGRLDPKHRANIMRYFPEVTKQFVLLAHSGEIDPEVDLAAITHQIGSRYELKEISDNETRIEAYVYH